MSQKILSLAILGCGDLFVNCIAPRMLREDGAARFRVNALCSPRGPGAAVTDQFPDARTFRDYTEMLEDSDAEAVVVLSPAQFHAEQTLAALRAGKHVYVQKPMGRSLAEISPLTEEAEKRGLTLIAAPVQGCYPTIQRIKQTVAAGELGPIYFATSPFMGWNGMTVHSQNHPGWRYTSGDGPLRDHGIYSLTTLIEVLGRVESVVGFSGIQTGQRIWQGKSFPVTEHDNTAALLRFASGALASIHEGWCAGAEEAPPLRIFGLEGSLRTFGARWDACPDGFVISEPDVGADRRTVNVLAEDAHRAAKDGLYNAHVWFDLLHLADCVAGQCQSVVSMEKLRHIYAVIDAIFAAAASGEQQRPLA